MGLITPRTLEKLRFEYALNNLVCLCSQLLTEICSPHLLQGTSQMGEGFKTCTFISRNTIKVKIHFAKKSTEHQFLAPALFP